MPPVALLQLRRQRRRDLEEIADDAVVGDFEDRRLGVLVDGDDRPARPSCRPGAEWLRRCRARRSSFGATVWPELPIWRSIGSQPLSQIGREAASSARMRRRQLLGQLRVLLLT